MKSARRARTTNAIVGPTRKWRLLPAPIGMLTSRLDTIECATGHSPVRGPVAGLLPAGNRPTLRRYAVPFSAEGARPPLGHAHLRRPLLAGREQRPVPPEPGEGADRPLGRLRPADADRLRPGRRARRRRGGPGRRADRPPRGHAVALR